MTSRRTLLKAAGGVAVGLPLMQWPRRGFAQSQPTTFPKRFVVMTTPNGVIPSKWYPTAGADESSFTLAPCLTPLERHREQLILTSGINMVASNNGPGEPHQRGMGTLLTGQKLQEGTFVGGDGSLAGWADGQSIDQAHGRGDRPGHAAPEPPTRRSLLRRGGPAADQLPRSGPTAPGPERSARGVRSALHRLRSAAERAPGRTCTAALGAGPGEVAVRPG